VAHDDGDGEGMTAAHGELSADASRSIDPFDPIALEARLAEARLRRSSVLVGGPVLAERSAAARDAPPPAPAVAAAAPPHPTGLLRAAVRHPLAGRLAAVLAGIAVGVGCVVALGPAPESRPPAIAAAPSPAPVVATAPPAGPPVAARVPEASAAEAARVPAAPPAEAAARPEPRPAGHQVARATGTAVRSARNAPRPVTPPQAVRLVVRDLNRATVGRTAATLGVRERLTVPGVPLAVTLDRRGLRVHERRVRGRR